MEMKIETEHYVLMADRFAVYGHTVLLSLGLHLFPGELAFNSTTQVGSIIIIGNATRFGVQLLGLV